MSGTRVTEICHLPIQQNVDVQSTMRRISAMCAEVPGMLSSYWGTQVEHPDILDIVAEWENLDYHKAYLASDTLTAVMGVVSTLMDTSRPVTTYHIPSTPDDTERVLSAPVLGICRYSNLSSKFEENFLPFDEEIKKSERYYGVVNGWVIEQENGREFVSLIGRGSLEAHEKAIIDEKVQEEYLKVKKHARDLELHHVSLEKYVK